MHFCHAFPLWLAFIFADIALIIRALVPCPDRTRGKVEFEGYQ